MSDSEAWILVGVPKRCRGILSAFTNLGEPADSRRMGLGIPLDPNASKLCIANGAANDVSIVDVKSRKELRRVKLGDDPWGIAIAPK